MHIGMLCAAQPAKRCGAMPTASVSTANRAPASGSAARCVSLSSAAALVTNKVSSAGPPKATLVTFDVGSTERNGTRTNVKLSNYSTIVVVRTADLQPFIDAVDNPPFLAAESTAEATAEMTAEATADATSEATADATEAAEPTAEATADSD